MIFVKNRRRTLWRGFLLALAVLPFSGCAVGPKYHPPVAPAPPAYKELGNWKPAQPNDRNLDPVLGQRGLNFEGDTTVESGGSTSGMVYYLYECYGGEGWNPEVSGGAIHGEFRIRDAFKKKAKGRVSFKEKSLDEMIQFAPGIESIERRTGTRAEHRSLGRLVFDNGSTRA
jgi:hypothetical protein